MKRWKEGGKTAFRLECFWIAALAMIFLGMAIPFAGAILPPDVTFIPDQISVNSSFIMIANPHAPSSEVSRIIFLFHYPITTGYGNFNNVGNKWIYYVSDTNLFPSASYGTPYTMEVTTIPKTGLPENNSVNVNVGDIPITSNTVVTGNNVYVSACAKGGGVESGISYKTYTDSLDEVAGKNGAMLYIPSIYCYTVNITLQNGNYYLAFTANSSTDFGGGVSRVVVGGSATQSKVRVDNIRFSAVMDYGQKEFKIENFTITNIGTENLTSLAVSLDPGIEKFVTIKPKDTDLEPNESTLMTVTLHNINSSMNISTFASLLSGSNQLAQIRVDILVSVLNVPNPASCTGKGDMTECLGGICCGEICRKSGADCCRDSDCPGWQTCSSGYKCAAVITNECEGKTDKTSCTAGAGICCSGSCISGGECCSSSDCGDNETCTSGYKCETQIAGECTGKADKETCTGGTCCSQSCVTGGKCCGDNDCPSGQKCNFNNVCESETPTPGIDFVTIGLIGGGVAAAAIVGFFLLKKFRKKGEGEEEIEGAEGEEEFSDEDFY